MKNTIILVGFIMQFFSLSICSAQKDKSGKIVGEYGKTDSTFNAGMHTRLSILRNGKYVYETGTHMEIWRSSGTWKFKDDTLTINSFLNQENIPITVKESRIDSLKNHIVIGLVKDLNGELVDAQLFLNNDTTMRCDPLMQNGCVNEVGSLNSIRVQFTRDAYTKWYTLKDKKANLIEITANVHDALSLFIFARNEQYVFKDGAFHYLGKGKRNDLLGEVLKRLK